MQETKLDAEKNVYDARGSIKRRKEEAKKKSNEAKQRLAVRFQKTKQNYEEQKIKIKEAYSRGIVFKVVDIGVQEDSANTSCGFNIF